MRLPTNESVLDRAVRIVLGLVLVALAATGVIATPLAYVGWAVASILVVTAAVGFCPLYALVGVSTRAKAS